jgi:hypothetical protein
MKSNFISRTGKKDKINISEEIENFLKSNDVDIPNEIPRSNINRLLSSEPFRNRVGISAKKGRFSVVSDQGSAICALSRIVSDACDGTIVLGNLWNNNQKTSYLNKLDFDGILPKIHREESEEKQKERSKGEGAHHRTQSIGSDGVGLYLIRKRDYGIDWANLPQRVHAIWIELQSQIRIDTCKNAVSVLLRVLLEFAIENYINKNPESAEKNLDLHKKITKISENMLKAGLIDKKHKEELDKMKNSDELISAHTLNRYIHSQRLEPTTEHLRMIWGILEDFVAHCLKA